MVGTNQARVKGTHVQNRVQEDQKIQLDEKRWTKINIWWVIQYDKDDLRIILIIHGNVSRSSNVKDGTRCTWYGLYYNICFDVRFIIDLRIGFELHVIG